MNTMKFKFSFVSMAILLLTVYITETECKVREGYYEKLKNLTKQPVYPMDFRQIIIDARHVLEKVLSKGKVRVLGVDDSCKMDSDAVQRVLLLVARFVVCLLTSQVMELACTTIYTSVQTRKLPALELKERFKITLYVLASTVSFLGHPILGEEFILLLMACAGARYLEAKRQSATITYGEGMACSFAEGYLYLVIPSDGAKFVGIDETIRAYESTHRVIFPVRRLLIVITKSLYCPPNLEEFNRNDANVPNVEACQVDDQSLADVQRNVAGVQNRVYRNTIYKLRRRAADPRPVHVVAECATPIHTLWKVLQKRAVYQRLAAADGEEINRAFCETLPRIVENSPELRGKCDLVFYDDTNPNENLAEVLLAKVREIEPNFEQMIANNN